jgi:hypothetical protein
MSIGPPPIGDPGGVNPAGVPAPDRAPGWPTPPAGATPGYGPPPPASAPGTSVRRPRRFWYAIGAVLMAIGAIASVTLFVVALIQLTGRAPADENTFGNNDSTTVHVNAGASKTIYVTNGTFSRSMSCTVANASGGVNPDLSPYSGQLTLDNWRALFTVSAQDGGDYRVSCSGPVSDARFGVGEHISAGDIAYPFIGAAAGVPFIIAGFVVLVVTVVRRSRGARL